MVDSRPSGNAVEMLLALITLVAIVFNSCDVFSQEPSAPGGGTEARYWLGPDARDVELKEGANLSGLDLRRMTLYGSDHYYSNVNFDRANLSGANLEGDDVLYTKFRNCTFRNAVMRRVKADWVIDASCDLTDADISECTILLGAEQLRSTRNYKNKDLRNATVRLLGTQSGFDFNGFDLRGTAFTATRVQDHPLFEDADFTNADIRRAEIRLTAEQLKATRSYKAKDLGGTMLIGDFREVSFRGFHLRNAAFMSCDLTGCDFTDADIQGMLIYGGGNYDRKGEWTANDSHCETQFTKEQLYATKSYRLGDLTGVQIYYCDLRGTDFSKLSLGLFAYCNLAGADFTGADYMNAPQENACGRSPFSTRIGFIDCNLSPQQFYSTRAYASKVLVPGCMLGGLDLRGWDFSDFDLRHVRFTGSDVHGANFTGARGGEFMAKKTLSIEQARSMRDYRAGKMKRTPGFSLPLHILELLENEPQ